MGQDTFVKINQSLKMSSPVLNLPAPGADKSTVLHFLIDLINVKGHHHYEEDVTQYQHAVQSAHLARIAQAKAELVAAALLHDIGHLLVDEDFRVGSYNEKDHLHEALASEFLSKYFPREVTDPIKLHVAAKRYLVSTRSEYFHFLSDASRQSYYLQGGPMTDDEISEFAAQPYFNEALQLRVWDDQAKDIAAEVEPVESYMDDLLVAMI